MLPLSLSLMASEAHRVKVSWPKHILGIKFWASFLLLHFSYAMLNFLAYSQFELWFSFDAPFVVSKDNVYVYMAHSHEFATKNWLFSLVLATKIENSSSKKGSSQHY